jgi:uncharacterized membrane protein YgcG
MDDNGGRGGRGGPKQSGIGPRGAGGRGRGPNHFRAREARGLIDGLPVLNYSKSAVNSDELQKWVSAMKTYTMANFIIGLDDIFLSEDPAYPEFYEPDFPDEDERGDAVIMEVWKLDNKEYRDNSKKLEHDKVKLMGVILGQMSEASKDQVKTSQEGKDAIEEKNPLNLIKVIISTHLTAGRIDCDQNLYAAETNYRNIQMGEFEQIATYHRRFSASLSSLRECASRAEKEEAVPGDELQSIHFISTLNGNYGAYKENFKRGIIPAPTTLQEAYEKIVSFGPGRSHYEVREIRKGVFSTFQGHGGRGGRGGRGGGFGRGGGRGACAICKQPGHWKNECPNRKGEANEDVAKAVEQVRDEKGKKAEKQKN